MSAVFLGVLAVGDSGTCGDGCAGDVTRLLRWKGNRACGRGSWLSDNVGMRGTSVVCRNVVLLAHLELLVCRGTRWCLYRLRRLWVECHRCDHGEKLVLLKRVCELGLRVCPGLASPSADPRWFWCVAGALASPVTVGTPAAPRWGWGPGRGGWSACTPCGLPWTALQASHLTVFRIWLFLALVLTGRDQRLHRRAGNKCGSWGWWFPFLTGQQSHRWGDWEVMWPHRSWNSRVVGVETTSACVGPVVSCSCWCVWAAQTVPMLWQVVEQ